MPCLSTVVTSVSGFGSASRVTSKSRSTDRRLQNHGILVPVRSDQLDCSLRDISKTSRGSFRVGCIAGRRPISVVLREPVTVGDLLADIQKCELFLHHVLFFVFVSHVTDGQKLSTELLLECTKVVAVIFIVFSASKKSSFYHAKSKVVIILPGSGQLLGKLAVDLAHLLHVFTSEHGRMLLLDLKRNLVKAFNGD